jgi:hypothetical protein
LFPPRIGDTRPVAFFSTDGKPIKVRVNDVPPVRALSADEYAGKPEKPA